MWSNDNESVHAMLIVEKILWEKKGKRETHKVIKIFYICLLEIGIFLYAS